MRANKGTKRNDAGQGMTEYIIIVALVAISSIGVMTVFGNDVRSLFGAATNAMAGDTNVQNTAKRAPTSAVNKGGLKNFGTGNGS